MLQPLQETYVFTQIQKRLLHKFQSIWMFVCRSWKQKFGKRAKFSLPPIKRCHKELGNYFKSSLSKREISRKDTILAGDFNINLIDFDAKEKLQVFVNLMFCFGIIPVNKPTRITEQTASAIDHFITNSITQTGLQSTIIKTDISDHFPFFFVAVSILPKSKMLRWNIYI